MRKLEMSELNRLSVDDFKLVEKNKIIIVLDNVRSLNNVGSFFRTADAFLIEAIYLCGITATPPHRDIHKTALGATETVAWRYFDTTQEAIVDLKQNNYYVYGVEQVEHSVKLTDVSISKDRKYALVFGNEAKGVDDNVLGICDACIEIDQYGSKHSLNVSVCAGIVMWEFFKQVNSK